MERIQDLIDKLYNQKQQGSGHAQLLLTVQLIHSELILLQQNESFAYRPKVSVTMPVHFNFNRSEDTSIQKAKESIYSGRNEPTPVVSMPLTEEILSYAPITKEQNSEPGLKEAALSSYSDYQPEHINRTHVPLMNPALETSYESPTLVQHQTKEIHEVIGESHESLNDRLKQEKTEVVHVFKEAPIKDLRKGIGINDRFTIVSELFRGDEAMYERSIKTINGFNILSEAEYWINRELKFKLGWSDNKEIVQHFYQLVRRRFA